MVSWNWPESGGTPSVLEKNPVFPQSRPVSFIPPVSDATHFFSAHFRQLSTSADCGPFWIGAAGVTLFVAGRGERASVFPHAFGR